MGSSVRQGGSHHVVELAVFPKCIYKTVFKSHVNWTNVVVVHAYVDDTWIHADEHVYANIRRSTPFALAHFDMLPPPDLVLGNSLELSPELGFTFDLLQLSLLQRLAFGHSGFELLNAFELLDQHSTLSHGYEHLPFSQDS